MAVCLYTYTASGTDPIGSTLKTTTVNVPSDIKPSVSNLTATIISDLNGKAVQGISQVKLAASAEAGTGSTISSYIFRGENISGTSSSYTSTSNIKTSSVIQVSGQLTYQVAVKDVRGRMSDYKDITIDVYTYAAPQITSISAQRCLADGTIDVDGTYAKVVVKSSYSSVGDANKRVVKLYNSADNYASETIIINHDSKENEYSGVYGDGTFLISREYQIKAVITDAYNVDGKSQSTILETATRTFNIAKYGNGIAIGGLSTVINETDEGKFECNWSTDFNDNLNVRGKTKLASAVQCYMGETLTFSADKDDIGEYIKSIPTYNRTYAESPNVYITSAGTFGRGASSSQRYKIDIDDVKDDTLNPYHILNIPVRQFKYNESHVPVNKNKDDLYIGLIAEEVAMTYPAAAEYNEDGQIEMWNIKVIVPAMLKILQDQQKEINLLKEELNKIKTISQEE
jgi:hypothetical protein